MKMTTKDRDRHKIRTIRNLNDLKIEKIRLKGETLRVEERIHGNYRGIVEAFTLRNMIQRLATELTTTTSVVSSAFTLGKSIIGSFRKKKKKKESVSAEETSTDSVVSTDSETENGVQ
jgi:hypothetical protein